MDQPVLPSGTDSQQDGDAIVATELQKLKNYRLKLAEDNQAYLDNHPELRTIMDDFVAAAISHKPEDIVKFGAFFFNEVRKNGKVGPCPVVVAGPSGAGKGTLINKLMEKFPKVFGFSVSHTTRAPREGEENGVHYNFVSKAEFEEAVENKEFLEYAKVHMNYYGTSVQAVEKVRAQGKVCILDIDIQGVQNVKKSELDCKYIFVEPPSMLELEKRLKVRGSESQEKIKIRLANAVGEMTYGQTEGNFDANIVNVDVNKSFLQLVNTLQQWFPDLDLYMGK